jgi:FSR family fosmidomycin resistance protein-like MFS transporter
VRKFAVMTGLYSFSHFIVDFSCAYLIFSKLSGSGKWVLCLFIYNFFAFALQMPLGIVADKINRNRAFAALGCVLIAFSPVLAFSPVIFCSIAGLGNAFFHIGAGRDILQGSGKRFSALGVFVSPGAIGLYLGTLCGKGDILPLAAVVTILAAVSVIIWFVIPQLSEMHVMTNSVINVKAFISHGLGLMLMCLFLVVCLRSYVGMTLSFPWKGEGHFALYLVIAVFCGKALGGILADRVGPIKVSCIKAASESLPSIFV